MIVRTQRGSMVVYGIIAAVAVLGLIAAFLFLGRGGEDPASDTTPAASSDNESDESSAESTPSPYERFSVVAGDWRGSWRNTTFGSTGSATASIEIHEDGTARFTLDLGGMVFGVLDPPPKIFDGTYDAEGARFAAQGDSLFGDMTITVDDGGAIAMSGLNIPFTNIDTLQAAGTITSSAISMTYTVGFPDGASARGELTMAKE